MTCSAQLEASKKGHLGTPSLYRDYTRNMGGPISSCIRVIFRQSHMATCSFVKKEGKDPCSTYTYTHYTHTCMSLIHMHALTPLRHSVYTPNSPQVLHPKPYTLNPKPLIAAIDPAFCSSASLGWQFVLRGGGYPDMRPCLLEDFDRDHGGICPGTRDQAGTGFFNVMGTS